MPEKVKSEIELKNVLENIESKLREKCYRCGEKVISLKKNDSLVRCKNKLCRKMKNIYENTIFHNVKLEKIVILKILELFMVKASNKLICYLTGVSNKTLWSLLKKLRSILVPLYYDQAEPIGGAGVVVQVDESKFGKRKYDRGHIVDGVWVLGAVEKTKERRIRLFVVENRKEQTLTSILTGNIDKDSSVHTDMWRGYSKLKDKFVQHATVNHSKNFTDPVTKVNTNTIEGEWCGIKLGVPYRGRTKDKIELYLVRYMILRESNCHPLDALIKFIF